MHALLAAYVWTEIITSQLGLGPVYTAFGLNNNGQVAVTTFDRGTGASVTGIYRNGTFTVLPPLPSLAPYQIGSATGINDAGVIVGIAEVPATSGNFPYRGGFILDGSGYRFFARPGWQHTEPRAIGNSGLVTGMSYYDTGVSGGFVYDSTTGAFTDATPPGSTFTLVQGINKFGRICGQGLNYGLGQYAFVWQQQTLVTGKHERVPFLDLIDIEKYPTRARGINDAGVITGFFTLPGSLGVAEKLVGFVGNSSRGYELLFPPGADAQGSHTLCQGINNANDVVCSVSDAARNTRAFIGSPH
jgi:hypothetical protein